MENGNFHSVRQPTHDENQRNPKTTDEKTRTRPEAREICMRKLNILSQTVGIQFLDRLRTSPAQLL